MISPKQRKVLFAFQNAINNPPRHFSTEAIDHLAEEVHDLNEVLKKEKIGLTLRSSWIEEDLSFVAVLEEPNGLGQSKPLLRLQVTPLSPVKAQIVASIPSSTSMKQKIYHHMDSVPCIDKLMSDVRGYIKAVIPANLSDTIMHVFNGVDKDSEDFKDLQVLVNDVIPYKYCGTKNPFQAYAIAH